jgi:hypothetical protein
LSRDPLLPAVSSAKQSGTPAQSRG